jgi:hypothetical protein
VAGFHGHGECSVRPRKPEDHMPNHNPRGNGRNLAVPEENRPSWRPEDPSQSTRRSWDEERDRDRYAHWTDERDEGWRTEREDRRGYTAGRYEDRDRSSRNLGYPGSFEEQGGRSGTDERWSRGGSYYWQDRPQDRHWQDRPQDRRYETRTSYYDDPYSQRESLGYSRETSRYYREPASPPRGHRGKGPMNYQRSDERIREAVCETLTDDDRIDASRMEVHVMNGDVSLAGTVDDRYAKRLAEEIVENIPGVRDIQNQLRVSDKRGNPGGSPGVGMEQEGSKRHRA